MKFGILIGDLSIDQARGLLENLPGAIAFTSSAPAAAQVVAPAAPSGQAFTPPPPLNTGDRDSKGMPYDERIHAGTKTKNADGQWKKRKGVDDATIAAVEAQIKPVETMGDKISRVEQNIGAPKAPAPAAPAPAAPVAAPPPPPPPAPAAAAPAAPAAPVRDFQGLMTQISKLFASQQIDPTYPNTIVDRINQGFNINTVATLTDIAGDPRMVTYAWQCLDVDGKAA